MSSGSRTNTTNNKQQTNQKTMAEEFKVGEYVYFGGNDRSFKVLNRQGDDLEILVGHDFSGAQKTRTVNVIRDDVTTASPLSFGEVKTQGFRRGTRSHASLVACRQ